MRGPAARAGVDADVSNAEFADRGFEAAVGVIALVMFALVPVHVVFLEGAAQTVVAATFVITGLVLGLVWSVLRRHGPVDQQSREPLVTGVLLGVPTLLVVNTLVILAATQDIDRTTGTMLVAVGVSAAVAVRWIVAVVLTFAMAGWVAVVLLVVDASPESEAHYAVQLLTAVVLGSILSMLRVRSEEQVHRARERAVEEANRLRAAQAALSVSERKLRNLYESSPVGISLSDERGRFVEVNAALCEVFGRGADELIGRSAAEFSHVDDLPTHHEIRDRIDAAADGVLREERRYLRPDGTVCWVLLTVTRTNGPQGQPYTLAHLVDVTERRRVVEALRDSELNLAAVARVSRRIQSGHDVRTEIVSGAVDIARANVAALVEPRDGVLTVTRSSDRTLEGATISPLETSATLEVFRTGDPIYAFDAASHPMVSQRLRELSNASSMVWEPIMRRGDVEGVLTVSWCDPVSSLSERSVQVIRLLADECSVGLEGETLRDELAALAHTDPLTALLNRRGWDERVQHLAALARRERLPLTLGIIDLDRFKVYNDEHGHAAGDDLLAGFARTARGILRDVDVLARWGGEEFVVALPGCDAETARVVLQRLCFAVPDAQTCSVGQYTWDGFGSIEAAIARADRALYSAKAGGRARVAVAV